MRIILFVPKVFQGIALSFACLGKGVFQDLPNRNFGNFMGNVTQALLLVPLTVLFAATDIICPELHLGSDLEKKYLTDDCAVSAKSVPDWGTAPHNAWHADKKEFSTDDFPNYKEVLGSSYEPFGAPEYKTIALTRKQYDMAVSLLASPSLGIGHKQTPYNGKPPCNHFALGAQSFPEWGGNVFQAFPRKEDLAENTAYYMGACVYQRGVGSGAGGKVVTFHMEKGGETINVPHSDGTIKSLDATEFSNYKPLNPASQQFQYEASDQQVYGVTSSEEVYQIEQILFAGYFLNNLPFAQTFAHTACGSPKASKNAKNAFKQALGQELANTVDSAFYSGGAKGPMQTAMAQAIQFKYKHSPSFRAALEALDGRVGVELAERAYYDPTCGLVDGKGTNILGLMITQASLVYKTGLDPSELSNFQIPEYIWEQVDLRRYSGFPWDAGFVGYLHSMFHA